MRGGIVAFTKNSHLKSLYQHRIGCVTYSTFLYLEMHSVELYRIMRKQKKNQAAKCYSQWGLNPELLILMPCMLLSDLIPHFLEAFRPLDNYLLLILGLFLGIFLTAELNKQIQTCIKPAPSQEHYQKLSLFRFPIICTDIYNANLFKNF